jgi:hypothetical protein
MGLREQTAVNDMIWTQVVGPITIFSTFRRMVTEWANENLDRLAPVAGTHVDLTGHARGGGDAGVAAAVAATAALEALSSNIDAKQIIQVAADGSWPEADVLLATQDASFGTLAFSIATGKPDKFQEEVLSKPYAEQTAGCLLLLKAIITRKPTLAISAINKQAFKNSAERKKLASAIISFVQIQSKPAADDFNSSCAGIRPPAIADLGAAWDLASQLQSEAWGSKMHM